MVHDGLLFTPLMDVAYDRYGEKNKEACKVPNQEVVCLLQWPASASILS